MITKEIILDEIEESIDINSKCILEIKKNYKERQDLDEVVYLYNEIKHLEYMRDYINNLQCAKDMLEEKELSINEINYGN